MTYDVTATRAGRRVEVVNRRGLIEVSEVTRGGTPVRTARFMSSRVLALVEHPAPRRPEPQRRHALRPPGTDLPLLSLESFLLTTFSRERTIEICLLTPLDRVSRRVSRHR